MRVERSFRWHAEGTHRYFPDWADLPTQPGQPVESDWNSYLAGGYAEEFGYRMQAGFSTGLAVITALPEQLKQFPVQIGALHPGFPARAKPLDRASDRAGPVTPEEIHDVHPTGVAGRRSWVTEPGADFKVIVVRRQGGVGTSRSRVSSILLGLWTQFRIRRRALGGFF